MRVYIHTNRTAGLSPSSAKLGYELVTGWWPTEKDVQSREQFLDHVRRKWGGRAMPPWMIEHSAKWAWSAEKARTLEPSLFTPLLLSDSDVIFQCSPAELLSRYKSFNAPLVASVEKLYSPRPPGPSWTFSEDYNPFDNPPEARQSGMRYPNSGLILGTRMGFSALSRALHALPTFPCCAARPGGSFPQRLVDANGAPGCIVNDQSCIHEFIANGMKRPVRGGFPQQSAPRKQPHDEEARIALDYSAKLFLSLYYLKPGEVGPSGDGRVMYTRTNTTPCVLHANGANKRAVLKMLNVSRMVDFTRMWVVQGDVVLGRRLSAAPSPPPSMEVARGAAVDAIRSPHASSFVVIGAHYFGHGEAHGEANDDAFLVKLAHDRRWHTVLLIEASPLIATELRARVARGSMNASGNVIVSNAGICPRKFLGADDHRRTMKFSTIDRAALAKYEPLPPFVDQFGSFDRRHVAKLASTSRKT